MAKELVLQSAFSAGELSPHLYDRVDLDAYYNGCAYLRNFVPLPHGPILRRRGTHFLQEAANTDIRLIPFTFNITQSFVLEFTPGYIRVFNKDGILLGADGSILLIASPYTAENLPNLNWAQNGDWLYLVDGVHPPMALKRYSNTNWAVEAVELVTPPEEWTGTNYPRFVAFFEQRAYYAATAAQPQQIWGSRTGLYDDFTMKNPDTEEVLDDHAFTYTIFSNDTNGIEWILPMGSLIIGTAGAEFKAGSTSALDPITPKNIRISIQTHYGSADIRPVKIGSSVLFIQRSRNRLRAFEYSFSEDQYTAQDLTIFASHILQGKAKIMQTQSAPDSYVWIITEDGKLVGCTYEKNQRVLAWHMHETNGLFKDLCVLPTEGNDQLFVAIEREVNGVKRLYIETLIDAWESVENPTRVEESFYVDSGLTYDGPATQNLVGLQHLNGRAVSILVDGWVHPDQTVVNGSITLNYPGSLIHVGLAYRSDFMSLVPQSQKQMSVGMTRRISEANIAVENSVDFFYRAANEQHIEVAYAGPSKVMNKAVPLTSRHQAIIVTGKSEKTSQLELWQTRPLPLIIRGIVYSINPSMV